MGAGDTARPRIVLQQEDHPEMKTKALALTLLASTALAACAAGSAQNTAGGSTYEVTITNNSNQVVTPPLVIAHTDAFSVFKLGEPAGAELAEQAETGNPAPLADKARGMADVGNVAVGPDVLPPGQSVQLTLSADAGVKYLSATGMLATTNDAIFAVSSFALPATGEVTINAEIYDAGSEANNELCSHIPGPPCAGDSGNANLAGEGTVLSHPGLTGVGDLDAAALGWSDSPVQITIRKL